MFSPGGCLTRKVSKAVVYYQDGRRVHVELCKDPRIAYRIAVKAEEGGWGDGDGETGGVPSLSLQSWL